MADYSAQSDHELLQGMQTGDDQSFVALYRRRHGALYRFALHMTGSDSTAQDVIQEVFLILIRRAERYDAGKGSVSAFLFGITRNCVLRHTARLKPYVTLNEERLENFATLVDDPAVALGKNEELAALRRAILALPEHYRTAIVLCDLQELSYEEAATVLGCAVGTVRSRLHRARTMLAERLAPRTSETESKSTKRSIKTMECEA